MAASRGAWLAPRRVAAAPDRRVVTRCVWVAIVVGVACVTHPAAAESPPTGELAGHFSSPIANAPLTVTIRALDGSTRAAATVPSGRVHFTLSPGTYRVALGPASGTPWPGCSVQLAVKAGALAFVNDAPLPRGCPPRLWRKPSGDPTWIVSHRGGRGDVTTKPGAYDGYRVQPCAKYEVESVFAIDGLGKQPLPSDPPGQARWIDRFRARLAAACAPMDVNVGVGNSCRGDGQRVVDVYISDWRQADEVIRRLGDVIRADDLGVGFSVGLMAVDLPE